MISSTLYFLLIQLNYHFPYPHLKVIGLQGRIPNTFEVGRQEIAENLYALWSAYRANAPVRYML